MSRTRVPPRPGQESVWDYPRPARAEPVARHLEVFLNGVRVAGTRRGVRVLETSHPPVYYFPPEDVCRELLQLSGRSSHCEWKGRAVYFDVNVRGKCAPDAAWAYPDPFPAFALLRDFVAFYPALMERCLVDGEEATPQPGGFYGGWVTRDVVGPFKGGPGTAGW